MLDQVRPISARSTADGGYTEAETQAMQRAVSRLFAHWGISDVDAATILGDLDPRTLNLWRAGELAQVSQDLLDRMSMLLSIHRSLRVIFTEPQRGYRWIKAPDKAFGRRSAFDMMLQGETRGIARVRSYLDAVRGF